MRKKNGALILGIVVLLLNIHIITNVGILKLFQIKAFKIYTNFTVFLFFGLIFDIYI